MRHFRFDSELSISLKCIFSNGHSSESYIFRILWPTVFFRTGLKRPPLRDKPKGNTVLTHHVRTTEAQNLDDHPFIDLRTSCRNCSYWTHGPCETFCAKVMFS